MALTPSIARAGAAPSLIARHALGGPVAPVDPSPVVELDPRSPLVNDGAAFRYEDLLEEDRRARADQTAVPDRRGRRLRAGLLANSSESFARAFADSMQFSLPPGAKGAPSSPAAIRHGIDNYELTSAVIHHELAPRGEQLSIQL